MSCTANPICRHYQVKSQTGSAGTEMVWKIFDAIQLSDNKDCSVFVFEKKIADKLHKPRRRETVSEILRREVRYLERFRHSKLLQLWHPIEECSESLAFVTEPVAGSLANFLGNYTRMQVPPSTEMREAKCCNVELELKLGIYQVTEGLRYLHSVQQIMHGNLHPGSILITRRGSWKISGLGFVEKVNNAQHAYHFTSWSSKVSKMVQPDLDYLAPELQLQNQASQACDIFALGLIICAIFNDGRSLLECDKNLSLYSRRVEELEANFLRVAKLLPDDLLEPVEKMVSRDSCARCTAQTFASLKCFTNSALLSLEGLLTCETKSLEQKKEFFSLLTASINNFSNGILYRRVFPLLMENLRQSAELAVYVLPCLLDMLRNCTVVEFRENFLDKIIGVLRMPKTTQATVVILERLHCIVDKLTPDEIKSEVLPIVLSTLEANTTVGQEAALNSLPVLQECIDEQTVRRLILPKAKSLYQRSSNVRMQINALICLDKLLDNLDKMTILDELLPFLCDVTFVDPDIYMTIIKIYKHMLTDKKFGLTYNLIASRVLPPLIPYAINPGLKIDQFGLVMEVLHIMMERIDRGRSNQMKLETSHNSDSTGSGIGSSRPPLIMMQQPTFEVGDLSFTSEDFYSRRSSASSNGSSRRQSISRNNNNVPSSRGSTDSSWRYDVNTCDATVIGETVGDSGTTRMSAVPVTSEKNSSTTSNAAYNESISKTAGTINDRIGHKNYNNIKHHTTLQGIGHSQSIEEKNTPNLCIPSNNQRRHSYGSTNPAGKSHSNSDLANNTSYHKSHLGGTITAGVCEGPFFSMNPPSIQHELPSTCSRRESALSLGLTGTHNTTDERLATSPVSRRSSFNTLSDTVMSFFSSAPGSNKT